MTMPAEYSAKLKAATAIAQEASSFITAATSAAPSSTGGAGAGGVTSPEEEERNLEDLHHRLFNVLYGGGKNVPHTDAVTMACLPLWTAAHHCASRFYFNSPKEHVRAMGLVFSLLPRVSDSRCYVTEPKLQAAVDPATAKVPTSSVTIPTALERRGGYISPGSLAKAKEEKSSSATAVEEAFLYLVEATLDTIELQALNVPAAPTNALANALGAASPGRPGTTPGRPSIGHQPVSELSILRTLVECLKKVLRGSGVEGDANFEAAAAGDTSPLLMLKRRADDDEDIFSVATLEYVTTILLFSIHSLGAEAKELKDSMTLALQKPPANANPSSAVCTAAAWSPYLVHILSFSTSLSAFGAAAMSTGGTPTRSIEHGMIEIAQNRNTAATSNAAAVSKSSNSFIFKDKFVEALQLQSSSSTAAPSSTSSIYDSLPSTVGSSIHVKGGADDDDDHDEEYDDNNDADFSKIVKQRTEDALARIAQEVDFMGSSSTARDLDSLTRTLRDVMFTPIIGNDGTGKDDGENIFGESFVQKLLFDRQRSAAAASSAQQQRGTGKGGNSLGSKRGRQDEDKSAGPLPEKTERRVVMPIVSSMSTMFGSAGGDDGEEGDVSSKVLLERIVIAAQK